MKSEEEILEWCKNAQRMELTEKEVKEKVKKLPRKVKSTIIKTFKTLENLKELEKKMKLKGGIKMPKKKKKYEDEGIDDEDDEDEEDEEDEEEDDEDEEEFRNDTGPGEIKSITAVKRRRVPRLAKNWMLDYSAETFRVIDPANKKIILQSNSAADLSIQLQVRILQILMEKL